MSSEGKPRPSITPRPDGPYMVKDLESFANRNGPIEKQEPWIDPDRATRDEIIATVRQCPSGALSYSVEGVEHRDREGEAAIFVSPNGPYVVTGAPDLLETTCGDGASTEHVTLCRCGGSKNKPFCDGTHWHKKFTDEKN